MQTHNSQATNNTEPPNQPYICMTNELHEIATHHDHITLVPRYCIQTFLIQRFTNERRIRHESRRTMCWTAFAHLGQDHFGIGLALRLYDRLFSPSFCMCRKLVYEILPRLVLHPVDLAHEVEMYFRLLHSVIVIFFRPIDSVDFLHLGPIRAWWRR